jgi:Ca-activated chloride channel homolog
LLGSDPNWLGTSSEAKTPLSKADGFFPLTAKIFLAGDKIIMEYNSDYGKAKKMDLTKRQHRLEDGSRRKLSKITIEVKTSEV